MSSPRPGMTLFRPCCEGIFRERPNRFLCRVEVNGRIHAAHCPNPGRMLELLVPGARVILEAAGTSRGAVWNAAKCR